MDKYHEQLIGQINDSIKRSGSKNVLVLMKNDKSESYFRYNQILPGVQRAKEIMDKAGISTGSRVAVVAEHSAFTVLLNLELMYIGVKAVLIDAGLPSDIIKELVQQSEVSGIFVSESKYESVFDSGSFDIPAFVLNGDFSFSHIDASSDVCEKVFDRSDEDVAAIIFSSGTTGVNKGVEITYRSLIYTSKWCHDYNILNDKTRFFDVIPSNHIAGYSTAMSNFPAGTEIDFIEEMSASALSAGLLRFNPRNFIMIPKVYEVMMNKIKEALKEQAAPIRAYANFAIKTCSFFRKKTGIKLRFLTKPIWKKAFGNSMLIVGSGTAPCKKEIAEFYLDLGMNFMDVYGSTETGLPITSTNVFEKYPLEGSGKVDELSYVDIKIVNKDKDGIGEILVKTELIMKGYFKDPKLTQAAFDSEGYFRTGDLGYIDKDKKLHIVGRIKESIVLSNGKKVSPADVDEFYKNLCSGINMACCGITGEDGYDEIHLFIERKNHTDEEINQAMNRIVSVSDNESYFRKLSAIHIIDNIPSTSIGKVKRYLLKDMISDDSDTNQDSLSNGHKVSLLEIIQKYAPNITVLEGNMQLRADVGMDSLSLFEMCADIHQTYGVDITNNLTNNTTISEIEKLIEGTTLTERSAAYDIQKFPILKTEKDINRLTKFANYSNKKWDIRVNGIENIKGLKKCILCPNHESHLDTLWIVSALYLNGIDIRNSCTCMGAEYVMFSKVLGKGFRSLGGIPVDRSGNPAKALKRALEYMNENSECVMMIHPEGTRTRDGKLGEFKNGAAELAIKTDVPIIPVCINGAREIYPPEHKLPSAKRINGKKQIVEINFGTPIYPNNNTINEITINIKRYISNEKDKFYSSN